MILTALCEKTAGGTLQMNCGTDLKQVPQSGTLFFWDSRSGQNAFKNDCMHGWNTTKSESLKRCHVFFVYFRTLLDKTTQEALQQSQKKNLLPQKKTHKLHSPSQIQESFRCSRKLLQSQTHWGNNGKKTLLRNLEKKTEQSKQNAVRKNSNYHSAWNQWTCELIYLVKASTTLFHPLFPD